MTTERKNYNKIILEEIFSFLNLDDFNKHIYSKNSWYGYRKESIYRLIEFKDVADEKKDLLLDDEIKSSIDKMVDDITDFLNFSSSKMFREGEEYVFLKRNEKEYDENLKYSEIVTQKSRLAYESVRRCIIFLDDKYHIFCFKENIDIIDKTIEIEENTLKDNRVFIVHGRNENAIEKVVNFINEIGLVPVILKDEPNKGYTIIEKFEQNSDVSAAIVLFFAEDIGCLEQEKDKMKPRARQNVIFEFGYFIAKLKRRNVIWLVDNTEIEIPTDISGLGYTVYNESWEESLIKELKEIGFNIKQ